MFIFLYNLNAGFLLNALLAILYIVKPSSLKKVKQQE